MTFRALASLIPLAVLAACASSPADDKNVAQAPAKVECEKSYSTGSMMPKKDCAPPMTEQERQLMQAEMAARLRQNSTSPPVK